MCIRTHTPRISSTERNQPLNLHIWPLSALLEGSWLLLQPGMISNLRILALLPWPHGSTKKFHSTGTSTACLTSIILTPPLQGSMCTLIKQSVSLSKWPQPLSLIFVVAPPMVQHSSFHFHTGSALRQQKVLSAPWRGQALTPPAFSPLGGEENQGAAASSHLFFLSLWVRKHIGNVAVHQVWVVNIF